MLRIFDAAGEEAHAENEQQVTQDGPEEGRLHDLQLALDERDDGDDQLDGVTERRVHHCGVTASSVVVPAAAKEASLTSSESLPDPQRKLFRAETEELGEGNDGEEGEDEDDRVVEVGKVHRPSNLFPPEMRSQDTELSRRIRASFEAPE